MASKYNDDNTDGDQANNHCLTSPDLGQANLDLRSCYISSTDSDREDGAKNDPKLTPPRLLTARESSAEPNDRVERSPNQFSSRAKLAQIKLTELADDCSLSHGIFLSRKLEAQKVLEQGLKSKNENAAMILESQDKLISIINNFYDKLNKENEEHYSSFKTSQKTHIEKCDQVIGKLSHFSEKYRREQATLKDLRPEDDILIDKVLKYNKFKEPKLPEAGIQRFNLKYVPPTVNFESVLKGTSDVLGHFEKE